MTAIEVRFVSLDSDQSLDPAIHPYGREEQVPWNLGPLLSKEAPDETFVPEPRLSELVLLAHRSVFPERPKTPGRIRPQMGGDRREEVVRDLGKGPEALEVVLERGREGAARKSREIEHGQCRQSG